MATPVSDLFQEPRNSTPLEPQERQGLIPSWVTHQRDLNEAEQDNILKGAAWAARRRNLNVQTLLSVKFMQDSHRRMFGDVWTWAGNFRQSERNIGVDAYRIPQELLGLLSDVRYWIDRHSYDPDEIAIRLHHRLVAIHPFPNGNGRHARLIADLLIEKLGHKPFSWGGGSLRSIGEIRTLYITALKAADRHDIRQLLDFART